MMKKFKKGDILIVSRTIKIGRNLPNNEHACKVQMWKMILYGLYYKKL